MKRASRRKLIQKWKKCYGNWRKESWEKPRELCPTVFLPRQLAPEFRLGEKLCAVPALLDPNAEEDDEEDMENDAETSGTSEKLRGNLEFSAWFFVFLMTRVEIVASFPSGAHGVPDIPPLFVDMNIIDTAICRSFSRIALLRSNYARIFTFTCVSNYRSHSWWTVHVLQHLELFSSPHQTHFK